MILSVRWLLLMLCCPETITEIVYCAGAVNIQTLLEAIEPALHSGLDQSSQSRTTALGMGLQ